MNHTEMVRRLDDGEDPFDVVIEKWQQIVDKDIKNDGSEDGDLSNNCAFCHLYFKSRVCTLDCPIFAKTKVRGCNGTPFKIYEAASTCGKDGLMQDKAVEFLEWLKDLKSENGRSKQ